MQRNNGDPPCVCAGVVEGCRSIASARHAGQYRGGPPIASAFRRGCPSGDLEDDNGGKRPKVLAMFSPRESSLRCPMQLCEDKPLL